MKMSMWIERWIFFTWFHFNRLLGFESSFCVTNESFFFERRMKCSTISNEFGMENYNTQNRSRIYKCACKTLKSLLCIFCSVEKKKNWKSSDNDVLTFSFAHQKKIRLWKMVRRFVFLYPFYFLFSFWNA